MPCSLSAGAGARPSREENAAHGGRSWPDGPAVFHAAERIHRRSGSGLELSETGLETIGRRAGFVRDGLATATGFPLRMWGTSEGTMAGEPELSHSL